MKTFLISIIGLAMLASCKKEQTNPPNSNKKQLLTAHSWKITGYYFYPEETGVIRDLYATWKECDKDDIFRLNADGTYTEEAGLLRCDTASSPIFWLGKWSLTGTFENELTVTPDRVGTRGYTRYIRKLTTDSLVLYFRTQPKDTIYRYIESYVKN